MELPVIVLPALMREAFPFALILSENPKERTAHSPNRCFPFAFPAFTGAGIRWRTAADTASVLSFPGTGKWTLRGVANFPPFRSASDWPFKGRGR
jgi:hypothetical protein